MLRNKSRAYREAVGMGEGTVLDWVARDKLMEMTPSDSIPAGNNWHQSGSLEESQENRQNEGKLQG